MKPAPYWIASLTLAMTVWGLRHREARSAVAIQNETSAVLDCFANARNDDLTPPPISSASSNSPASCYGSND
jgi:hypothetical protein